MKIIFIERVTFGNEDIIDAYHDLGYEVIPYPISNDIDRRNTVFETDFAHFLEEHSPDYVFSFNYEPIISVTCKKMNIDYLSWTYDSPYVKLYSCTAINPCNHIFIFDKSEFMKFYQSGIPTVHYLPMAANVKRLDTLENYEQFCKTNYRPAGNISFIGALYNEPDKHLFFDRMESLSDYTKGYLNAIMEMQIKVHGHNFIEEVLKPQILTDMRNALSLSTAVDGVESIEYLYANYVINRKITEWERLRILPLAAEKFGLDLYTLNPNAIFPNTFNHGPIDYYKFAPHVFKTSNINLNISLRSIHSGIPLRCFDIMGAGGFLLSNFQSDFLDFFVPGEDFAAYLSTEEMINLIAYYLEHEDKRNAIARNGYEKVKAGHTYIHRIHEMESYLN